MRGRGRRTHISELSLSGSQRSRILTRESLMDSHKVLHDLLQSMKPGTTLCHKYYPKLSVFTFVHDGTPGLKDQRGRFIDPTLP